jgi:hypothetical protein
MLDDALLAALAIAAAQETSEPVPAKPRVATEATRADEKRLAELESPGDILFTDDFESEASLAKYFEVRGAKDGRAAIVLDPKLAHSGHGALRLTSPANDGNASGAGVSDWLGDAGFERVHLRYYLKFAADYDQGNLNHTGGSLAGVAGNDKWRGMGTAGLRPAGDDHFSTSFETWRDWGRAAAPGFAHFYAYWMEMERDRDGNYWGILFMPEPAARVVPARDRWTCFEVMVKANAPEKPTGEMAAWIDGRLYLHVTGIRWRSDSAVMLKRFGLDVYVHKAARTNTVWYDDVVVSTGYVGRAERDR